MRFSKISLTLIPVLAVSATALTIPANAAEIEFKDNRCNFTYSASEKKLIEDAKISPVIKLRPSKAKEVVANYSDQLKKSKAGLSELEKDFEAGEIYDKVYYQEKAEIEASMKLIDSILPSIKDCAANAKTDAVLSNEDGELNDAGIGVVVAAVLLLLGGAVAAVLPQLGLV